MLLSPIQGMRPRITQKFGLNPQIYKQFGMEGHNGLDYGVPVGTPIHASHDGIVTRVKKDKNGYGWHIRIRTKHLAKETIYAHLSRIDVKVGDIIAIGQQIALSGNTGFSTGPHLHFGWAQLIPDESKPLDQWHRRNYSNGYYGWIDPIEYIMEWEGTHLQEFFKQK